MAADTIPWVVKINETLSLEYECKKSSCEPCQDINLLCSGDEMITKLDCVAKFDIDIPHNTPPPYINCIRELQDGEMEYFGIFVAVNVVLLLLSGYIVHKKKRENTMRDYQRLKNQK